MKSLMTNLTLLSMGLLLFSCNEKISPELETGATAAPTAIVPTDYYFKVTNTSPTVLNYKLHRTGPNNQTSDCAVTSSSTGVYGALSSANYSTDAAVVNWDDKNFDISCFFEAEELSLFYNGFQFEVSASPNTCAYVGYAPFSFYDKIPGSSSTSYTYVNCDDDVSGSVTAVVEAAGGDIDYAVASKAGCGSYVDNNIPFLPFPAQARAVRSPADEADLCAFNYTDVACDEGIININPIDVVWVEAVADDPLTVPNEAVPAHAEATAGQTYQVSCGGDHMNCVKGPLKELGNIYAATSTELHPTTYNTAFSTGYAYEGGYGSNSSNKTYVNFRRNLANPNLIFGTSLYPAAPTYLVTYAPTFGDGFSAPEESYQPALMNYYSYNLKWTGVNPVLTSAEIATQTTINGYTAEPYAAEPFLGFDSHRVNPFYTFYCFDEAYEIKGRIRMVVREWDRVFPTATASLSYISDIGFLTDARQDYAAGQATENPNDPDAYNAYNDIEDWDDYLFMVRDPLAVTITTLWEPASGFFNSAAFTNGDL